MSSLTSRLFINSVTMQMRSEGGEQFTVQEIQFVSKLKLEVQTEDGFQNHINAVFSCFCLVYVSSYYLF